MKWGVNEAERSGKLLQTAGAAKKAFSLPWKHKLTGSASEDLEESKKRQKGTAQGHRKVKQWQGMERAPHETQSL